MAPVAVSFPKRVLTGARLASAWKDGYAMATPAATLSQGSHAGSGDLPPKVAARGWNRATAADAVNRREGNQNHPKRERSRNAKAARRSASKTEKAKGSLSAAAMPG
jgi:hypothetical protein